MKISLKKIKHAEVSLKVCQRCLLSIKQELKERETEKGNQKNEIHLQREGKEEDCYRRERKTEEYLNPTVDFYAA